jgi:hypothetical protein
VLGVGTIYSHKMVKIFQAQKRGITTAAMAQRAMTNEVWTYSILHYLLCEDVFIYIANRTMGGGARQCVSDRVGGCHVRDGRQGHMGTTDMMSCRR